MTPQTSTRKSEWPHRLAVTLVCATFPLIWVGGLVTTTQAGMAVPDWPSTYGYNLFLYPIGTWLSGPWDLFIEHGHRLLASLVGLIAIAAAASLWKFDDRYWVKLYGIAAVVAVSAQGILGGMRVLLDERTLAMIHGCTGPAFFAMAVALAVVTSRWWKDAQSRIMVGSVPAEAGRSARLAMLTTGLAYVQLVLGAQVRHIGAGAGPLEFQIAVYFHLVTAAVLTVQVFVLAASLFNRYFRSERAIRRPAQWLVGLIVAQLLLGCATWVAKYAWPGALAEQAWTSNYTIAAGGMVQAITVTAHVATGSLILVISLVLTLRLFRLQAVGVPKSLSQSSASMVPGSSPNSRLHFASNWHRNDSRQAEGVA